MFHLTVIKLDKQSSSDTKFWGTHGAGREQNRKTIWDLRYGSFSTDYIEVNLSVFSVLPVDRLAGELGALLHCWLMALTVIWYCWPQSSSDRKPLVMLVLNASVFPFPLTASTAYVLAPALEAQLRVPSPVPQSRMGVKAWGTHGAKEPENRTALKLSWGLCLLA